MKMIYHKKMYLFLVHGSKQMKATCDTNGLSIPSLASGRCSRARINRRTVGLVLKQLDKGQTCLIASGPWFKIISYLSISLELSNIR